MKALLIAGLIVLPLLFGAAPSSAATADFQGNCVNGSPYATCDFDAQRGSGSSCPGSFIWKYSWDFGDGTGAFTGSSTVTHQFAAPGAGAYQVTLNVICWDGNMANRTRWVCLSFGFPGCILVNNGWN